MATLAQNKPRNVFYGDEASYPVVAADVIYEGAAVGENASGYARPLQAGDPFLGIAVAKADNTAGSAGDIDVQVRRRGLIRLPVAGATIASNDGVAVYASDDDTFTTTATSNSLIGYVVRWLSGTDCIVDLHPASAG